MTESQYGHNGEWEDRAQRTRRLPWWLVVLAAVLGALLAIPSTYFMKNQFGPKTREVASAANAKVQSSPTTTSTTQPQPKPAASAVAVVPPAPKLSGVVTPPTPAPSPSNPIVVSATPRPPDTSTPTVLPPLPPAVEAMGPVGRAAVASLQSGFGIPMLRVQVDHSVAPVGVSYRVTCSRVAAAGGQFEWLDVYASGLQMLSPVPLFATEFEQVTSSRDVVFQNAFPYPAASYRCDVTPRFNGVDGATVSGNGTVIPPQTPLPAPTTAPVINGVAQETGMTAKIDVRWSEGTTMSTGDAAVRCRAEGNLPEVFGMNGDGIFGFGTAGFRVGATYTCKAFVPGSLASAPFSYTPANIDNLQGVPGRLSSGSIPVTGTGFATIVAGQPEGRSNAEEYAVTALCKNIATGATVMRTRFVKEGDLADPSTPRIFGVSIPVAGDYQCQIAATNGLGTGPLLTLDPVSLSGRPSAISDVQVISTSGRNADIRFRPSNGGPELSPLITGVVCDNFTTPGFATMIRMRGDGFMEATIPNLQPGMTHTCSAATVFFPVMQLVSAALTGNFPGDLDSESDIPWLLDFVVASEISKPFEITMPAFDAPGVPGFTAAEIAPGEIGMTFTPPANQGGGPVNDYWFSCTAPGIEERSGSTGGALTATAGNLEPGRRVACRGAARNAGGQGPWTEEIIVQMSGSTAPLAPGLEAAPGGPGEVVFTITPPTWDGGSAVDSYNYSCVTTGESVPWELRELQGMLPVASQVTVQGLQSGATYACAVSAHNVNGNGPLSETRSVEVTLHPLPDAPTVLGVDQPEPGTFVLTVTPPAWDGGLPITGYYYRCDNGNGNPTIAALGDASGSITLTGFVPGFYYACTARAVTAAGWSPLSNDVVPYVFE